MLHASHARPAWRQSRTKATNDSVSTHTGTCIQRTKAWYRSTVWAFIIPNSNAETAAAAIALQENNKCTQLSRCLHQTARYIAARVKHAPTFIDQTMVIQLIEI